MFNLSRPVKHSKERRKRLPISEAISPLKVAGEEHPAFRFALVIYILNILLLLLPFFLVLFLC
jgi:hypothetical protein